MAAHNVAHLALLRVNRLGGIDYGQAKFAPHSLVLIQDLSLKDFEAVFFVVRPAHVHAAS